MSKTITYSFSTPADSNLTIVTADSAMTISNFYGTYNGFAIQSISGTFNGESVQSVYGASGQDQKNPNGGRQDNLITTKDPVRFEEPPFEGIDPEGISFTTNSGHLYNIYTTLDGLFEYTEYSSPSSSAIAYGRATLASTNYDSVVCFASGTLIRTSRGDIPVENLAIGDIVVTASGALRPIAWLGHRTVNCRSEPAATPVRIRAHAFDENRPARGLLVSPGHAICVDVCGEMLIPAHALIDGIAIVQEDVERITYWHVELDSHDVILAENLPCESYLEMGNRGFFADAEAVALHATPDAAVVTHDAFCRPFVFDGPRLAAARARLAARATRVVAAGDARSA